MGDKFGTNAWTDDQSSALMRLIAEGYSSAQVAVSLNEQFGTAYTRNSVIGKCNRLKLDRPEKPRKPKKKRIYPPRNKDRLRIVAASGNSNHLRLIVSRESADVIKIRCDGVSPRRLSLTELEPNDCRFPYGDGPFTFCGHPKMEGQSWCESHFHWTRRAA